MRFSVATIVAAALAGVANAFTQPVGPNPIGNPISAPALAEQVEVGKPFKITWQPTTPTTGTVTLVLLRGPSTNVKPLYAIAEKIPNSGSYEWTPKADLTPEKTHYGIQLIVDSDGQYQYTAQFGIKKEAGAAAASSDCTTTTDVPASTSCTDTSVTAVPETSTPCPESKTKKHHHHTKTATQIMPYPANNGTAAYTSSASLVTVPSATVPVATTPATTAAATASSTPIHTGAAGKNAVAAGAVAFGALAVAMGL